MHIIATWQQIPHPTITQVLDNSGCNVIVFDMEHGEFTCDNLMNCIRACKNTKPYIRIRKDKITDAIYALDRGIKGIIFADIRSQQEVIDLDNMLFNRGFGLTNSFNWSLRKGNYDIICQIESIEGIKNASQILCNCNFAMLGPYDLSKDIALHFNDYNFGDFQSNEFIKHIDSFNDAVPKKQRAIHLVEANMLNRADKYCDYGFLAIGMDTTCLLESTKELIDKI